MAVRQRGDSWQADVRFEGQRIRCSFNTPGAAHEWEIRAQADAKLGKRPAVPAGDSRVLTLKQAADKLLAADWRASKSRVDQVRNITQVIEIIGPAMAMRDVGYEHVETVITKLRETGNTEATIRNKLMALSKLFTYAKRFDSKLSKPYIPKLKKARTRTRYLEEAEYILLRGSNKWPEKERNLITFLWYTGARVSEALGRKSVQNGWVTFYDTKNGSDRTIPLNPHAAAALKAGIDVNYWTFYHRFKEIVDDLKLGEDVVIHTLRHSFATRVGNTMENPLILQEWLGHKSLQTTRRYVKPKASSLMKIAETL